MSCFILFYQISKILSVSEFCYAKSVKLKAVMLPLSNPESSQMCAVETLFVQVAEKEPQTNESPEVFMTDFIVEKMKCQEIKYKNFQ